MSAQEDLDELVNFLLPAAGELLGNYDEFFPIAAVVTTEGELTAVGVEMDEEQPESTAVIDMYVDVLRAQVADGGIRACGICADVVVETPELGKSHAARVELEHAEAEPVNVYLPYAKEGDEYAFGELIAVRSEPRVFGAPPA